MRPLSLDHQTVEIDIVDPAKPFLLAQDHIDGRGKLPLELLLSLRGRDRGRVLFGKHHQHCGTDRNCLPLDVADHLAIIVGRQTDADLNEAGPIGKIFDLSALHTGGAAALVVEYCAVLKSE